MRHAAAVFIVLSVATAIAAPPGVPSTSKAEEVGVSTERLARIQPGVLPDDADDWDIN